MEKRTRPRARRVAGDVFAGLTLWAVFAAQALAYSRLAHATPVAGLVTAIAGALLYAVFGSSRRVSIGPAGAVAAIVGTAVSSTPPAALAESMAALTLMTAGFLVIGGLLRISFLQRLFPTPVFVGYLAGTGISILYGQGKDLVTGSHLHLAIGLAAIAATFALKRFAPKVPAPFAVLLSATIASVAFGLGSRGAPIIGSSLGHFGSFILPEHLGWAGLSPIVGPALSLALLVYVDALANADALAQKGDPPVKPVREFFALGVVNAASGIFGGFVAACSSSRSIVGIRSGEQTRLAGGVAGVLLLLTALSVVRFLSPMPLGALAGVVFVAAIDLIDVRRLKEFWSARPADFLIAAAALLGVLVAGPVLGVGLGVGAALIEAFRRAMSPDRRVMSTARHDGQFFEPLVPGALPLVDGILIYRFGAPLFFGNADAFVKDMEALATCNDPALRVVVINADALGIPDATARDALRKAERLLAEKGVELVLGNARRPLREALRRAGGFPMIDEDEFVADVKKFQPNF